MKRLTITFDPKKSEIELDSEMIKNFHKEFPDVLAIEIYPYDRARIGLQIPDDMDTKELYSMCKKNGFHIRDMIE